jgi:hypothetical protein
LQAQLAIDAPRLVLAKLPAFKPSDVLDPTFECYLSVATGLVADTRQLRWVETPPPTRQPACASEQASELSADGFLQHLLSMLSSATTFRSFAFPSSSCFSESRSATVVVLPFPLK